MSVDIEIQGCSLCLPLLYPLYQFVHIIIFIILLLLLFEKFYGKIQVVVLRTWKIQSQSKIYNLSVHDTFRQPTSSKNQFDFCCSLPQLPHNFNIYFVIYTISTSKEDFRFLALRVRKNDFKKCNRVLYMWMRNKLGAIKYIYFFN